MTAKIIPFKTLKESIPVQSELSSNVYDLTLFQFPISIENGRNLNKKLQDVGAQGLQEVTSYFKSHGLYVNENYLLKDCLEMWSILRFNYGQAIRLLVEKRPTCVLRLLPDLNFIEKNYCQAVADQDLPLAKALAQKLFKEDWQLSFTERLQ